MSRYVIRNNVHYGTVDEMVNTIKAKAAEIERLRGNLAKAVQFTKGVIRHAGFWGDGYLAEQARTALAELTGAQKDGN